MTLPVFIAPISPSAITDAPRLNLAEVEFGDGYSQATAKGYNHIRRVLTLTWDYLEQDEKNDIEAFLKARKGYESFTWTPPGETLPIKWTCKEWQVQSLPASLYSMTATFAQSFTLEA